MTVDVDAVNERLNGLVNLLHVVGIDGVDPNALVEEQQRLAGQNKTDAAGAAALSSDQQILEIIKKLQQAQADSPEILAALKSPELRALASLAAQKQGAPPTRAPPPPRAPEPEKKAPPSLEDIMDDDDNYPKIGPGYSDDISVVSDLTTPTVMTSKHIQDEEYYKDLNGGAGSLPPMNIALGGGPAPPARPPMTIGGGHTAMGAPKKRNLVSAVHPGASRHAIAKPGGAAAQRRLNYQQAMAKLQSTGDYPSDKSQDKSYMDSFSPKTPKKTPKASVTGSPKPAPDPSEFFPSIAENKKARPRRAAGVKGRSKKNLSLASQEVQDAEFGDSRPASSKKTGSKDDWGTGGGSGWPAFDGGESSKKSKDAFGKDDAFFGTPSFGAGGRDTKSPTKSPSKKKGKEEKRFAEIKITRDDGQGTKKSTTKEKKEKEKVPRPKKSSRRASLSM
jgi:hypothetical protein